MFFRCDTKLVVKRCGASLPDLFHVLHEVQSEHNLELQDCAHVARDLKVGLLAAAAPARSTSTVRAMAAASATGTPCITAL